MKQVSPIDIIAPFVIEHLPDSITQREPLLRALDRLIPDTHPQHGAIGDMIAALQQHQVLQRELPGLFTS